VCGEKKVWMRVTVDIQESGRLAWQVVPSSVVALISLYLLVPGSLRAASKITFQDPL